MTTSSDPESVAEESRAARADPSTAIYPRRFSTAPRGARDPYLSDAATLKLAQFFEAKGISAIKQEERSEQWYEDWLSYQAENRIYASVLTSKQFSTLGA